MDDTIETNSSTRGQPIDTVRIRVPTVDSIDPPLYVDEVVAFSYNEGDECGFAMVLGRGRIKVTKGYSPYLKSRFGS